MAELDLLAMLKTDIGFMSSGETRIDTRLS